MTKGFGRATLNFRLAFSTTPSTAGASVQVGDDPAYIWEHGIERYSRPWECAQDMVAELEGYEIIGPFDALGIRRIPIKRVVPVIAGNDIGDNISPNEHMLPVMEDFGTNITYPFRDRMTCTNLGKALLMGGAPDTTSVKIGPLDTLNFKVEFPTVAHGGDAAIATDMIVKAHIAFAKGEDQMITAMKANDYPEQVAAVNGGNILQKAVIGDIESYDSIGAQNIERSVPLKIDEWSSLNMGQNADDPQIKRIMFYAKNNVATTPNQEMELVREGSFVQYPFQNMDWNATDKKFYQFDYAGFIPHVNSHQIKFDKGNSRYPMVFNTEFNDNQLVMPLQRLVADARFFGPSEIERRYTLMKEIGSIKVTDNGVSIPAWAAGIRGFEIALWGKEYTLK